MNNDKVYVILHASRQPFISLGCRFGGIKLYGYEYFYLPPHDAFLRKDFVKKYNKHMKSRGSWEDFINELKKEV